MTEARVLELFDACNGGDADTIASFFTHDAVYQGSIGASDEGTVFQGVDEVREGMASFLGAYDDARYSDIVVHVFGNRGFATWTFSGTPVSGERFSYRGVDILEFTNQLIRFKDAYRKQRTKPIGA